MFNEEASFIMGAIGTLIGLVSLTPMLTTGRRWFAAISLILGIGLIIHGFYRKALRGHVTIGNIESKIREWLDAFELTSSRITPPDSHFGWQVNLTSGVIVWILRTTRRDKYITFVATVPITQENRLAFEGLTLPDKSEFWRGFFFEACRSRIVVTRQPNDPAVLGQLFIEYMLPITSDLNEATVIESVRRMDFSFNIVFNVIGYLLRSTVAVSIPPPETQTPPTSALPLTTQPSPTLDTAASPPSPTS